MEQTFYDIHSIATVLGCIMKDTSKLKKSEINLSVEDFTNRPHKILFSAIQNLTIESGKETIDDIDVDAYLSAFPIQHQVFKESNLAAYINYAKEIAKEDSFLYSYTNVKKLSLLRDLNDMGMDTTDIYCESKLDARYEDKALKFSKMSIKDIIEHYSGKHTDLKMKWTTKADSTYQVNVSESVDNYLDNLNKGADIGTPMPSKLMTAVARGNRKKNIYLTSGGSGTGKSRVLLSNALHLSVGMIYNPDTGSWEKNQGIKHNTLFISTELEDFEIMPMCLAYISCVEESKIKKKDLTEEEFARVLKASEILKDSNFQMFFISDFDTSDIADIIETNIRLHQTDHIFLDYIQVTPKAYQFARERYGTNLAEHHILTYMLSELKEICNTRNVFLHSATQLNRSSTDKDANLGANSLRGSFGMTDKISLGCIRTTMTSKDYEDIEDILRKGLYKKPSTICHIFKNRGEKWKNVKVYTHFDLGTLREVDCFVTDNDGKLLDIAPLEIKYETEEVVEENTNVFTSSNIEF